MMWVYEIYWILRYLKLLILGRNSVHYLIIYIVFDFKNKSKLNKNLKKLSENMKKN